MYKNIYKRFLGGSKSAAVITLGFTSTICAVLMIIAFSVSKIAVMDDFIHNSAEINRTIQLNNKILVDSLLSNTYTLANHTLILKKNKKHMREVELLGLQANSELHVIRRQLMGFTFLFAIFTIAIASIIRKQVNSYESLIRHERDNNMLLAIKDPLTGLTNRLGFERYLALLIEEASENAGVLMYLDLDQFKIVNDTCGHHAGDQLLKQLAGMIRDIVRTPDIIARTGGDEFAVVIRGATIDEARLIAGRIRQTIEEYRFVFDNKLFNVSVSIGMTQINAKYKNIHETLIEADVACYMAKDAGRNTVHIYNGNSEHINRRGEINIKSIKR